MNTTEELGVEVQTEEEPKEGLGPELNLETEIEEIVEDKEAEIEVEVKNVMDLEGTETIAEIQRKRVIYASTLF